MLKIILNCKISLIFLLGGELTDEVEAFSTYHNVLGKVWAWQRWLKCDPLAKASCGGRVKCKGGWGGVNARCVTTGNQNPLLEVNTATWIKRHWKRCQSPPFRGTLAIEVFHNINKVVAVVTAYGNQPSLVGWQADEAEVPPFGSHPRLGRPPASLR